MADLKIPISISRNELEEVGVTFDFARGRLSIIGSLSKRDGEAVSDLSQMAHTFRGPQFVQALNYLMSPSAQDVFRKRLRSLLKARLEQEYGMAQGALSADTSDLPPADLATPGQPESGPPIALLKG